MIPLAELYATDEDIHVRDPDNFADLVPDIVVASGSAGSFNGSTWLFTDVAAAFIAAEVVVGMILVVEEGDPSEPDGGVEYAITSITPTTLTLQLPGMSLVSGQPPPAASGIPWSIRTFIPQIELSTYELDQRFNIDDNTTDRQVAYLYESRELRQACVLMTLANVYASANRTQQGDYAEKLKLCRSDLETLLERVRVKWGQLGQGQMPTNSFGTTLER